MTGRSRDSRMKSNAGDGGEWSKDVAQPSVLLSRTCESR